MLNNSGEKWLAIMVFATKQQCTDVVELKDTHSMEPSILCCVGGSKKEETT